MRNKTLLSKDMFQYILQGNTPIFIDLADSSGRIIDRLATTTLIQINCSLL